MIIPPSRPEFTRLRPTPQSSAELRRGLAPYASPQASRTGFTLIELLLVLGIISTLAGVVILAIAPEKTFIATRDAERDHVSRQISQAIETRLIDTSSFPGDIPVCTEADKNTCAKPICRQGTDCSAGGGINLDDIVPTYLPSLPTDALMPANARCTGYMVYQRNGRPYVFPANKGKAPGDPLEGGCGAAWSCGNDMSDPRDGATYATVLIGSRCWMAENLNVGTQISGSSNQTNNGTIEKYCYSDTESNCTTYGGLYQWDEAMGYTASCNGTGESSPACASPAQGICPVGWHMPSHYEYVALERAVCTSGTCASDFPYDTSTTGWRGTNEGTALKSGGSSGFAGLPAGYRVADGSFYGLSTYVLFWSSLESGSSVWHRYLYSGYATVFRNTYIKANGFSIRCLKD